MRSPPSIARQLAPKKRKSYNQVKNSFCKTKKDFNKIRQLKT
ncbi:hypothetical protein EC2726950_1396 [Escherichia coli 2726950]|nr:hypothetical protein ECDEC3E_2419 [Escherichia coli DEC3E]ENA55111.1 hypothetical protein EC2726950_1396 [Escherichia coli 2726950]